MFGRALANIRGGSGTVASLRPLPVLHDYRFFASKVAFVKKIYSDGSTCQKCDFVWKQIEKDGLVHKIDRTVVADERDPSSEGIVMATKHNVKRAPFFVVEDDAKPEAGEKMYDVYFKLKKDVFAKETG